MKILYTTNNNLLFYDILAILCIACAIVLAAFQYSLPPAKQPVSLPVERWRSSLTRVASVEEAMPVVWDYIQRQSGTDQERTVRGVDAFVRDRFLHGFSYTPWRENWLLAALGSISPFQLNVPVDPDSILQHRHAICSQQSIVFMELLRRFHIDYAAVRFKWPDPDPFSRGHFAVAAKVDGRWRFYDPDMEAAAAPLVANVVNGSAVATLYPQNPVLTRRMRYAATHGGIIVTDVNRHPGPRGYLLQRVTKWISVASPLILLLLGSLALFAGKKPKMRAPPMRARIDSTHVEPVGENAAGP
jgi:hypothetical protein